MYSSSGALRRASGVSALCRAAASRAAPRSALSKCRSFATAEGVGEAGKIVHKSSTRGVWLALAALTAASAGTAGVGVAFDSDREQHEMIIKDYPRLAELLIEWVVPPLRLSGLYTPFESDEPVAAPPKAAAPPAAPQKAAPPAAKEQPKEAKAPAAPPAAVPAKEAPAAAEPPKAAEEKPAAVEVPKPAEVTAPPKPKELNAEGVVKLEEHRALLASLRQLEAEAAKAEAAVQSKPEAVAKLQEHKELVEATKEAAKPKDGPAAPPAPRKAEPPAPSKQEVAAEVAKVRSEPAQLLEAASKPAAEPQTSKRIQLLAEDLLFNVPEHEFVEAERRVAEGLDRDQLLHRCLLLRAELIQQRRAALLRQAEAIRRVREDADVTMRDTLEESLSKLHSHMVEQAQRALKEQELALLKLHEDNARQLQSAFEEEAGAKVSEARQLAQLAVKEKLGDFVQAIKCVKESHALDLAELRGRLEAADQLLGRESGMTRHAGRVRQLLLAALEMQSGVAEGRPLAGPLGKVQQLWGSDFVVGKVLNGLAGPDIQRAAKQPLPTFDALRSDYYGLVTELKRSAFSAEEGQGGVFRELLSHLFAALYALDAFPGAGRVPAGHEVATAAASRSPLERRLELINQTTYYVNSGSYLEALRSVEQLDGAPKHVVERWAAELRDVLTVRQAAEVIKSRVECLNATLVQRG